MTTLQIDDTDSVIDWLCDGQGVMEAQLDLAMLGGLIGKALEMDGLKISVKTVVEILTNPIADQDAPVTAGTVFVHGADWMVSLAEHFGFIGEADDFIDTEWLNDRPHMRAVYQAITELGIRATSAVSDMYESQHGHSMLDVFLASIETGESLEESRVRLTTQRKGLRTVH